MMNVGGRAGVNNSFPEHNSATVRNTLMIFGRSIERVSAECRVQDSQLLSSFSNYVPDPYFNFIFVSGAYLRSRLIYFNGTW